MHIGLVIFITIVFVAGLIGLGVLLIFLLGKYQKKYEIEKEKRLEKVRMEVREEYLANKNKIQNEDKEKNDEK